MPVHIENLFFEILLAGFVPILTHPERLIWIESGYGIIQTLAERGVWMQITSGSLLGKFSRRARYWAERMLSEGLVHILATDAHDNLKRPPDLVEGCLAAEMLVGAEATEHLVITRPSSVLENQLLRAEIPLQKPISAGERWGNIKNVQDRSDLDKRNIAQWMRRFFYGAN
jgi:protein-tyrosine phosphatase